MKTLPTVTAGFANAVEAVKKYAAPIQAGTKIWLSNDLRVITNNNPTVAINSPIKVWELIRFEFDNCIAESANITFANTVQKIAPKICAAT